MVTNLCEKIKINTQVSKINRTCYKNICNFQQYIILLYCKLANIFNKMLHLYQLRTHAV